MKKLDQFVIGVNFDERVTSGTYREKAMKLSVGFDAGRNEYYVEMEYGHGSPTPKPREWFEGKWRAVDRYEELVTEYGLDE